MSFPEPNGAEPDGADPPGVVPNGSAAAGAGDDQPERMPFPLVASCVAGVVGVLLLVAGAISGAAGLSVAGVVAGTLSLCAALYWRSLLISSWAARKQGRPPR